jgi:hypothetical protein
MEKKWRAKSKSNSLMISVQFKGSKDKNVFKKESLFVKAENSSCHGNEPVLKKNFTGPSQAQTPILNPGPLNIDLSPEFENANFHLQSVQIIFQPVKKILKPMNALIRPLRYGLKEKKRKSRAKAKKPII